MSRCANWVAALAVAVAGWHLSAQEPLPVNLGPLREAVEQALKRGENVDEVRKALDALDRAGPKPGATAVPAELQALRDAVDAAARKGEGVAAIAKELAAVETAVVGRSLEKPKPGPRPLPPDPGPQPPALPGFPNVQPPVGGVFSGFGGGIDRELFDRAMDLRRRATEQLAANPNDPEVRAKMLKMLTEANEMVLKAARGGGAVPPFPEFGRFERFPGDRGRLGVRMDRVPAVAADQLGLEPNVGIVITAVVPDSPAEKAGLKANDIVLEFAGKPVTDSTEEFARRVLDVRANEKVDLVVLRKGKKVDVKGVELPEARRPQPLPVPELPRLNAIPVPAPVALPEGFNAVSYTTNNDAFTLKAKKGDVKFELSGTLNADGTPGVKKAVVTDGDKAHEAESVEKLPAAYRDDAKALLQTVRR